MSLSAGSSIPPCVLSCALVFLPHLPCALDDQQCLCANTTPNNELSDCILANCTTKSAMAALRIAASTCNYPAHDVGDQVLITATTVVALALIAVIFRLIARYRYTTNLLGMDDLTIVLAQAVAIAMCAVSYPLQKAGLGKDVWLVSDENITESFKLFWLEELLYMTDLALTKISILFLYLRIFPNRRFRLTVFFTIGITVAWGVAFITRQIFECTPISLWWRGWDGEHHDGHCISGRVTTWLQPALNILLDLFILVLPLPILLRLNLGTKAKWGTILMFSVGIFITIVSALRLRALVTIPQSKNITKTIVPVSIWSFVEVAVSIICACLPGIRGFLALVWPKIFASRAESAGSGMQRPAVTPLTQGSHFQANPKERDFVELVTVDAEASNVQVFPDAHSSKRSSKAAGSTF